MWITSLCLSLAFPLPPQTAPELTPPAEVEARRAAVERSLVPAVWVEGHAFTIEERMRMLNVPGVSVAVLHDGALDWAAAYGVRDTVSAEPVTTETLFQAASISKPVSAMAAVRLAEDGILDLDAPINDMLGAWKLPAAESDGIRSGGEVTARRIMSHTAGLNVHGFPGFGTYEPLPSAVDVVAGRGQTDAVVRIEPAGETVRYSGGGSTVLQLAMCDVTGQDFAGLVEGRVLRPLGMTRSTYAQPLPVETWPDHAAGHDWTGRRVAGRFHVYPQEFAAGLWTTPTDLARFALELQRLARYENGAALDAEWGQAMLTPQLENAALGLFLERHGDEDWFGHGGSNEGFKCMFRASFEGGRGIVVMTNGDQGSTLAEEIARAATLVYGWPGGLGEPLESVALTEDQLQRYAGRYAFGPDDVLFVELQDGRLVAHNLPAAPHPLAPLGSDDFAVLGSRARIRFTGLGPEGPSALSYQAGSFPRRARRIGDGIYWPCQDLRSGNVHAATAYYRDVHELNPDDELVAARRLVELAVGLWNCGRPAAGLALMQTVAELYPADAGVRETLGRLQAGSGKREAAAESYRRCLRLLPEDADLTEKDRAALEASARSMLRWLEG